MTNTENWRPFRHLYALYSGTSLSIRNYCWIDYGPGWAHIVDQFIDKVGHTGAQLDGVADEDGALRIKFSLPDDTHELTLIHSAEAARLESMHTCCRCGASGVGQLRIRFRIITACPSCRDKIKDELDLEQERVKSVTKTGTWLDDF